MRSIAMPTAAMTQTTLIDHAMAYIGMGWNLVVMPHGSKGPKQQGWNTPAELVNTADRAQMLMSNGPVNMGLVHQPSGTCAIDIDDEAWARHVLAEFGIDMDDLLGMGPRILSKEGRAKVLFRAPADLQIEKITWQKKGAKAATDRITILELRAGPNQDVLPPSLHPDGHQYTWSAGQAPWDYEEIPNMPEQLLDFWRLLSAPDGKLKEEIKNLCPWLTPWEKRYIPDVKRVSGPHQDAIGKFNDANPCEDMLESAGYKRMGNRWMAPSSTSKLPGVVVLKDKGGHPRVYSHHGSDPLADGHSHDAFSLLTILVHNGNITAAVADAARQVGVERRPAQQFEPIYIDIAAVHAAQRARDNARNTPAHTIDMSTLEDVTDVVAHAHAPEDAAPVMISPTSMPADLLKPPGVIKDVMDWMLGCAQRPNPVLALAGALSMVSACLAQKVESQTGLRTNNYIVAVGDTSSGKDHARKCIKVAFQAAGQFEQVGGEEVASGTALLGLAAAHPNAIIQLDEFGLLMKAVSGKNAATHSVAVITNLMKLFSSAGTIYTGTEFADRKARERVNIEYPCINLHATTTAEPLFQAFSSADITSGYLNRLLVIFAPTIQAPLSFTKVCEPPAAIVDWMKAAKDMSCGMAGVTPANPITLPMDRSALAQFTELHDWLQDMATAKQDAGMHHLWGRAWEHASKIALVCACAQHNKAADLNALAASGQLVVDGKSAEFAIRMTKHLLSEMEREVIGRVSDSEFEANAKAVVRVIEKAGIEGLTARDLSKVCRQYRALEPFKKDAVIDELTRNEDIFLVQMKSHSGRGRPRMAWVSTIFQSIYTVENEFINADSSLSAVINAVGVND